MKFELFKPEDFTSAVANDNYAGFSKEFSAVLARTANGKLRKWLSEAPVVNAYVGQSPATYADSQWSERDPAHVATHTARLVCIEPIARDTADQLVRDLANHAKFQYQDGSWAMDAAYWVDRACKLLGGDK